MKRRWIWAVVFFALALLTDLQAPAFAQVLAGPDDLPSLGTFRVDRVIDGDTLVLDDGRQVRLTGIQAPKLSLGRPNVSDWPLGPEAKTVLEDMLLGQTVTLKSPGEPLDRHERLLAHVVTRDGHWAQGDMVEKGFARVYTFADNPHLAPELLERERAARAERRGIWAKAFYIVRTPVTLDDATGTFQIVEGTVVSAQRIKNTVYLNFGNDWRTDFTVSFDAKMLDDFRALGLDPLTWKDKRVRVRGWIQDKNGPLITLTHPQALEAPPLGK